MAMQQPGWVVSDLMDVLGLDKETVETMIAPDLVRYTNETRLRSHLQDFLGPSPKAKAFISRYVAFQFPSIASSSSASITPSHLGPHPEKPVKLPATAGTQSLSADDLGARFGPGGRVYQKNRDGSSRPSASGSGSNTPTSRQAGAVTFNVHEPKPKRVDSGATKGKQGEKIWDVPKSREVRKLEGIIGDLRELQNSEGKVKLDDGKESCFCQARNHPISRYTPHCPHCGLILCKLHRPHHPCPSCLRTLQTPAQLSRLINQIEAEVEAQLALEQTQLEAEERARLERLALESGGGSFPVLPTSGPNTVNHDVGRKVLTINSAAKGKGKGKSASATLTTTYSRPSPTPSRPATPPPTDIVPRPRSPPLDQARGEKELSKMLEWRENEDRPWGDLRMLKKGGWSYIPAPVMELAEEDNIGRRRRRGRENAAKGIGVDGKKVVGAA